MTMITTKLTLPQSVLVQALIAGLDDNGGDLEATIRDAMRYMIDRLEADDAMHRLPSVLDDFKVATGVIRQLQAEEVL